MAVVDEAVILECFEHKIGPQKLKCSLGFVCLRRVGEVHDWVLIRPYCRVGEALCDSGNIGTQSQTAQKA